MRINKRRLAYSFFDTLYKFSAGAFIYEGVTIIVYPNTQLLDVSHYIPIPTNIFMIASFATSGMSHWIRDIWN